MGKTGHVVKVDEIARRAKHVSQLSGASHPFGQTGISPSKILLGRGRKIQKERKEKRKGKENKKE